MCSTWLSLGLVFTGFRYLTDLQETGKCIVVSSQHRTTFKPREILPSGWPILIASTNKLSYLKMNTWHAHVSHMAKNMNTVLGLLWWGTLGPGPLAPL